MLAIVTVEEDIVIVQDNVFVELVGQDQDVINVYQRLTAVSLHHTSSLLHCLHLLVQLQLVVTATFQESVFAERDILELTVKLVIYSFIKIM